MDIERLTNELEDARKRADELVKLLSTGGAESSEAFGAAVDVQLEAERRLAAARGEEHAIPFELGVDWDGGAPLPHLLSSEQRTFVAFYLVEPDPDWDGSYVRIVDPTGEEPALLGLVEFRGCAAVKLGPPNDEVLRGHPLHGRGLDYYGAYVVANSRWLARADRDQSGPRPVRRGRWTSRRHFLFVFHDEIVEAIARDVEVETFQVSMPTLLGETIAPLLYRSSCRVKV